MNIRHLLLSALSISAIGPSATSAPLISIGDNADVFFNGSTGLRWSSNIFRDEDDEVDDLIWTLTPGFELNVGRGLSNADLSIVTRYEIRRYFDQDQLDSELFSIGANGSYRSSRLDLSGSLGYINRESTSGDGSGNVRDDLIETDNYNARIDAEYRFSPKLSLGSGIRYSEREYVTFEERFADRETFSFPVDIFYELTPKVDLSIGYIYSQTDVEDREIVPGDQSYETEDHFFNVGARGNLLPKVTGFFKIGYRTREDDRSNASEDILGLDADLTWTATPKLTSRLGLSRDFGVGGEGQSTENTSFDLTTNYSINSYYSASAFISYSFRDYETDREDDQYEIGARLTYTPNQYLRFGAGYTFSENDSTRDDSSYTDHTFDLSVSLRY